MRPRSFSSPAFALAAATVAVLAFVDGDEAQAAKPRGCPERMVSIRGRYCIDQYEASTVEVLKGGKTRKHSPFKSVTGLKVKAMSQRGVKPQAHISRNEAEEACRNAGKRLCTDDEWVIACKGRSPTTWPYGKEHRQGHCNDRGVSSFNHYYGAGAEAPKESYTWANMNDARLNMLEGTLAPTGAFKKCRNGFNVYDMVGNLHEWTQSGAFRGGYYLDTHINGSGCDYKTTAHSAKYHDYSTGFRCCK
jgi:formylglycine-generating enzyme